MYHLLSRLAWFTAGVVLTLALLEVVLHFLPVSTGLHRTDQFARWPLQDTEPRFHYTYSINWAMLNAHRGVTNNYGHVAPFDFRERSRPLIVIGDSYVESLMNDYADTLQGQLGRKLGAPESVYGLGASGLSASDYVALSRLARDEFSPAAAVFVVSDGDLSESLLPQLGSYYLQADGDDLQLHYKPLRNDSRKAKLRRMVGDLSLHRYLQVNLQFSFDKVLKVFRSDPENGAPSPTAAENVEVQRKIADWFLSELPGSLGLSPECIVLLVDTDRYAIYRPEAASTRKDHPLARGYLIQRAQDLGFRVSDLDVAFRHRFAQDRVKFDYWPIDRHWNKVGHGVAAQEAYRLLHLPGAGQQKSCLATQQFDAGDITALAQRSTRSRGGSKEGVP